MPRLVLVGDDKQLQSIDAGGGFSGLSKRLGYAELKEITRQRDAADRQAVYDMAEGNPGAALKSYAERDRLILGDDLADTMQRLVAEWRRDKTDLKEKLILSSTNHQAAVINRLCQWERQKHGELALKSVTVAEGAKVHSGDRVLFTRNDKRLSVNNGDLGTVIKVRTADEEERSSQAGVLNRKWRPDERRDADGEARYRRACDRGPLNVRPRQHQAWLLRDDAQGPGSDRGECLCVLKRCDDRSPDGLRPGIAGEKRDANLHAEARGWPRAYEPYGSHEPRSEENDGSRHD